jgi:aminoglycoside phosphotransferase (APT) family kinase protein
MAENGATAPTTDDLLDELLPRAGLPKAVGARRLSGRGFDHEIELAELADGRQVVLRRWRHERESERAVFLEACGGFLEAHDVPAPRLLAATAGAGLYEFAPGTLLGDLIEAGRATENTWRLVGAAFRRVHAVGFPAGLVGDVEPDRILLRPVDPVAQMHAWLDGALEGLQRRAPSAVAHVPALHALVDRAAGPLRGAATALGHGDIHMWNIIVGEDRAWLIDWDEPRVCDPAMEVALLDKHAWLFNGRGLDAAFFSGYGRAPAEPNTSLHRVVQALRTAASGDTCAARERPSA